MYFQHSINFRLVHLQLPVGFSYWPRFGTQHRFIFYNLQILLQNNRKNKNSWEIMNLSLLFFSNWSLMFKCIRLQMCKSKGYFFFFFLYVFFYVCQCLFYMSLPVYLLYVCLLVYLYDYVSLSVLFGLHRRDCKPHFILSGRPAAQNETISRTSWGLICIGSTKFQSWTPHEAASNMCPTQTPINFTWRASLISLPPPPPPRVLPPLPVAIDFYVAT